MNTNVGLRDKENFDLNGKAQQAENQGRTFGRDITNTLQQPLVDIQDEADAQRLGYYAKEIFEYLHSIETRHLPSCDYLNFQSDINSKMRAILVDWIIDVHYKFKLIPETLYLTVNLIDRYLSAVEVQKRQLQLVGVGALMIATKYEEIYPPEVKDFVHITDNAYTSEDVLFIEREMLRVLEYNVTITSPYRFLERYNRLQRSSEDGFYLSQYMIELGLLDYRMLKYKPSLLAASAIFLSNKFLKNSEAWPSVLRENSTYRDIDLKTCAKDLCVLLQNANNKNLQSLKKKFSSKSFNQVATLNFKAK